jgi:hypothetical protein
MINIYTAFTVVDGSNEPVSITVSPFVYVANQPIAIVYRYKNKNKDIGCVYCEFKGGCYQGFFVETYNNKFYRGEVKYSISIVNEKVLIHGTWRTTRKLEKHGYDVFAGTIIFK